MQSYVLNLPLNDEDHGKCWVCCPCCLADYSLDEGVFVEIPYNNTIKNIKVCKECESNMPLDLLTHRIAIVIKEQGLEKELEEIEHE